MPGKITSAQVCNLTPSSSKHLYATSHNNHSNPPYLHHAFRNLQINIALTVTPVLMNDHWLARIITQKLRCGSQQQLGSSRKQWVPGGKLLNCSLDLPMCICAW